MKVLITGGAGFIGSHTADALLARGYQVRALDCLDPQIHGAGCRRPPYLDARVELRVGDVRSRLDLEDALDGVEAVFHLAAQTGVGQSMYAIHSYSDHIINGTAMLLDVLANRRHSVRRIILASSRAVYGEGACRCAACGVVQPDLRSREQLDAQRWDLLCPDCGRKLTAIPTPEDQPQRPISVYALAKQVQEQLLTLFSRTYGVPAVILRYFNVYGPRQAINNPYTGIGAIFTNRVLADQNIAIYEDGRPGRDFVHVHDVVQANLLALEQEGAVGGTFNVGTGECLTILDLAELIRKTLGSRIEFNLTGQFRLGDIRNCYADLTRSQNLLGYAPKVSMARGVGELIDWARGERVENRSAEAETELKKHQLA
jgi:dTDP-L-rhamnose 4-epimerase